jgi:hypothetical protein
MTRCRRCGREMDGGPPIIACGPGAIRTGGGPHRDREWDCQEYCSWECLAGRPLRRCLACGAPTPTVVEMGTGIVRCANCNHAMQPASERPAKE